MASDQNKTRKRKGGKNSKTKWRKQIDLSEVEEYLINERKEERTGGCLDDKSDESLFFVDQKIIKTTGKGKKVDNVDDDEDEEAYVPRREKQRKRFEKEQQLEKNKEEQNRNRKVVSIWGQEAMTVDENDYLEPVKKKTKVKPTTVGKGKSKLKAIETPEKGSSYNPDYESHQELLRKAVDIEVAKLTAQEKLNKKVKMVSVEQLKKQSKLYLKEMSEGLGTKDKNAEESEAEEVMDEIEIVKTEPKTMKNKRKTKEEKEKKRLIKEEKQKKLKMNDVYRLKTLKKEIQKEEKEKVLKKKIKLEKSTEETRTKRLGKHKYEEPVIAVNLSEELTATLREMKPEGSLLNDNFKSLQKRNVIETRKPVIPHHKHKRKLYVKRSYKTATIKDVNLT